MEFTSTPARTATSTQEVSMYQRPGHTLVRATVDAEYVIEGDRVVGRFGDVSAPIVDVVWMSGVWVFFVDENGSQWPFRSPIDSHDQPRVETLRNQPVTDDDYYVARDER